MSARREVAIGLSSYAAYLGVRWLTWSDRGRGRAQANADRIVALERRLGLDVEPRVQTAALRRPRALDALNAGYAGANVALSVGWLMVLFRRGSPVFVRERRAAVFALLGALPVFAAFPTAPPRTREDFVDTLAERGIDIEHPLLVRFYNPIAAMPSHHVAFAVVTAVGKASQRQSPVARLAWFSYPVGVSGVVLATGNHYLLDTFAGAALGGLARKLTR